MKCSAIESDLSAFLDGELNAQRQAEVDGHLSMCDGCRETVELLSGAQAEFRKQAPEQVSENFRKMLHANLEDQSSGSAFPWLKVVLPVAVAASLFLFFMGERSSTQLPSITEQMLAMDLAPAESTEYFPEGFTLPVDTPGAIIYQPCLDPSETSINSWFAENI